VRRVKRFGSVILPILTLGVFVGAPSAYPTHRADHKYSIGVSTWAADNLTGVRVYRYDENISAGGLCGDPFVPPIMYQSQWVPINPDPVNDWIELGTMHKTAGCKYWYWGYAVHGQWVPIGTSGNVGNASHYFEIVRGATGNTWKYNIDVTTIYEAPIYYQRLGKHVHAGLEGYNPAAIVPQHFYYNLQFNVGGPWYYWRTHITDIDPPMCGGFSTDTLWRSSQNSPC